VVVRHHYEEQRRRILEALDQEIHEGQRQVKDTREDAIERLEQFVAKYSGSNADPHATPDAMFRLAALYEERARTDQDGNLSTGLQPAMALYRKIIETFPNYEELAGVAYYLGHAYTDSGRLEQGQQAWRSLVCKNRFPIVGDPSDPSQIVVAALPPARPRSGAQTVLVVEDADGLRELARRLLQRQGYTVLVAANAEEALRVCEQHASIDVLLTDVVMPGASGPELTRQLVAKRPTLKVIYMSGYTEEAIVQHGVLNAGVAFLHKPFTSATLGRKIREVLDQERGLGIRD